MTWREIYLKVIEDVQRVQLANWKKVGRAITHAIATYDKSKKEGLYHEQSNKG